MSPVWTNTICERESQEWSFGMKSDIQIAQEAEMLPIKEVAEKLGIGEDDLELYGKYKAKLSDELIERVKISRMES